MDTRGLEISRKVGSKRPVSTGHIHGRQWAGDASQPCWSEGLAVRAVPGTQQKDGDFMSSGLPVRTSISAASSNWMWSQTTAGAGSASLPVTATSPGVPGGRIQVTPPGVPVRSKAMAVPDGREQSDD